MWFLLIALAVVVVAGIAAGGVFLASRARSQFKAANEVVPGRPTRAPASWAGSHDPEALLHRRLRDAMTALRANQAFDYDGGLLDLRVELEEQALRLDDQLVAVASLARMQRDAPLVAVAASVEMIETAVVELSLRATDEAVPRLEEALERIRERTGLMEEIRSELDRLPAASTEPPSQATQNPADLASAPPSDPPAGAAGTTEPPTRPETQPPPTQQGGTAL